MAQPFILGMLAETPIHPGTGQAAGAVDLPVAREAVTGYPHQPETGLKGALREWARETLPGAASAGGQPLPEDDVNRLFGTAEAGAGELLITTGRLLLLPVRRLDGPYAWVTTPGLVERFARDIERVLGKDPRLVISVESGKLKVDATASRIFLEEFPFEVVRQTWQGTPLLRALAAVIGDAHGLTERLARQLAVMDDDDFGWYAENGLPVAARNKLNYAKSSENLWYEETLPTDTLLYAAIIPRYGDDKSAGEREARFLRFRDRLTASGFLRIGGNETVGQGWVRLRVATEIPS